MEFDFVGVECCEDLFPSLVVNGFSLFNNAVTGDSFEKIEGVANLSSLKLFVLVVEIEKAGRISGISSEILTLFLITLVLTLE